MSRFRLRGSEPQLTLFRIIVSVGGVATITVLWAAVLGSSGSIIDGAMISAFVAAWSVGMIILFGWSRRGSVDVDDKGIVVTRPFGTSEYRWPDVVIVRARNDDRQQATNVSGTPDYEGGADFAEIILVRRTRIGLLLGRDRTRGPAPPVRHRTIALYVDDPEGLVAAARLHVLTIQ